MTFLVIMPAMAGNGGTISFAGHIVEAACASCAAINTENDGKPSSVMITDEVITINDVNLKQQPKLLIYAVTRSPVEGEIILRTVRFP